MTKHRQTLIPAVLCILGAVGLAFAAALVFVPLGIAVLSGFTLAAGLLVDFGR